MRDWIDLGASTPPMESGAQVGTPDYVERARRECRVYIHLLRRVMGDEPPGASLGVMCHPHDFGTYLTTVCHFETDNQAATEYAYRCESEGPEAWDDQARAELVGVAAAQSADAYEGKRLRDGTCEVVRIKNGSREPLTLRLDLRNHSPSGFEWGYGGSGPAQLALALLADAGDGLATTHYQSFKATVVCRLPDTWTLKADQLRTFVSAPQRV